MPKAMGPKLVKADDIHMRHMADDAAYRQAYAALEDEFRLVNAAIEARLGSLPSQAGGQSKPAQDGR